MTESTDPLFVVVRTCRKCGTPRHPDGKRPCLPCSNRLKQAARERAGVEGARRESLWRLYRLTLEDYDRLRAGQDNRCAICGQHEDDLPPIRSGRPRRDGTKTLAAPLVVDHCHDTGKIRGLLCSPCNIAIGLLKDNAAMLRSALAYVEEHYPAVP